MSKNISAFIEELKDKNDITDVIGRYVPLSRNGNKYWGRCPFHHEKTPSFAVNADGQYYHCFGCNESGDVIKFIQKIESLEFMEAVKFLSEKSGMALPEDLSRDDQNTAELKKNRDRLFSLLKNAAKYYYNCLKEKGGAIQSYLAGRGITGEYITKFGLGYSPDYNGLIVYLKGLGYSDKEMEDSGVALSKNGRLYDHLGTRLIIPIINSSGDVIAFGGRAMDDSGAKYKNTSETSVFNKSKNLYAVNLVKKAKQEKGIKGIIVVEGYMDAIALHQAGFACTVASMGTSLTKEQARLIKRYTDEVYICYDGDSAGQTATMRGLDILKNAGLNVRVISMPDDTDPDEYIKEKGSGSFKGLMENAPPLSDFKLLSLAKKFDLTNTDGKRKYTANALKVIAGEGNQTVKEELLKLLRSQTDITYESLKRDLENIKAEVPSPANIQETPLKIVAGNSFTKAVRVILYCALYGKSFAEDYAEVKDFITDEAHLKIFSYITNCRAEGKPVRVSAIFENEDTSEAAAVAECGENMEDTELVKCYNDCVNYLKSADYEKKLKILTMEFEQEKDIERRKKLALEIQVLTMEQRKNYNKGSKV